MFDRFRSEYGSRRDVGTSGVPWLDERLTAVAGYSELAEEFAGASFAGGLYRVHDEHSGPRSLSLVTEAFPEFRARVRPFGYDWLGRQLAIDSGRVENGQALVLLLEPGTGEVLEISASFTEFHDEELIEYADAALAEAFFQEWSGENPGSVPLGQSTCVGYRQPLFLAGRDVVDNLEVIDLDVYWTLFGQIRQQVLRERR